MLSRSAIGRFAIRHRLAIAFISVALCLGVIYAALHLPSSVFPQTNFPRVVIMVDNGVMPADQMMANVTRPIEETMKDIPRSEEHTSELQSLAYLVCRLLLEKKKKTNIS